MTNNIFKLQLLKDKYIYITDILSNLIKHIKFLEINYLIENDIKNNVLTDIFYINKNINNIYNKYINNMNDSTSLFIKKKNINENTLEIQNSSSQETINNHIQNIIDNTDEKYYNNLLPLTDIFIKYKPYKNEINKLIKIININGYSDLLFLLKINNIDIKLYSEEFQNLLLEINNHFIPISFNTFDVNISNSLEYYWRIPTIYSNNDILQSTRELWFKKSNNSYYKIEGVFTNDIISIKLKTSEIISNYLYNKKRCILKEIELKNCSVNLHFTKKFIRYDYIGNIYCMNLDEYINYLSSSYKLYLHLTKLSFVNIMKNFINNGSKLYNLYNLIFLLLLGNDDNAEVASLLLNLTKEKKNNSNILYDLINRNLSFYMQLKIKKGGNNIKTELEKIKSLTLDSVDYKKKLLSIKNIPNNVKLITLEKIEEMKTQNNEYYKQKMFVDNILKYPWSTNSNYYEELNTSNKINDYLNDIKSNLNKLTYGHIEVKNVLLQIIANWITNPSSSGKPLGFVGPPGVGKTLLAKSISKALKIPFAEITLGGQNDGELLHGHGYTYSGSQPGLIIKKMVDMGQEIGILFFDELDKTSAKHGTINEITSILIHLTDPNMNKSFQDRFFQGIDFPLDKVIFIFSYNDASKIDPILLDRLTQIKINSYTIENKINIIKEFIIPEFKLNININIDDSILEYIIDNYTNESGIRDIKRKMESIYLTLNLEILTNKINIENYVLTIEEVNRILLKPNNDNIKINEKSEIGIINGLYATSNGNGGIIQIQIFNNNFTKSSFELKLTGKQGDVMKESVHCSFTCALAYLKQNIDKYNINNFDQYFQDNFKNGFHIHIPATSTPKDGPSAGCAFTCAFISRILNIPIKNNIAITGEIELTGKVTKIGGLVYKLIGAKKAGVTIVFIPKENNDDLIEIKEKYPKIINDSFQVILIDHITELIDLILDS
jgi:ATP-dependent Lon protease